MQKLSLPVWILELEFATKSSLATKSIYIRYDMLINMIIFSDMKSLKTIPQKYTADTYYRIRYIRLLISEENVDYNPLYAGEKKFNCKVLFKKQFLEFRSSRSNSPAFFIRK